MDASKPLLPKMSIENENFQLDRLWKECEAFLTRWKAYDFTTEDKPADAIVAILELQARIVARRGYILGLLHQEELPF
jgi:hypothetical protein